MLKSGNIIKFKHLSNFKTKDEFNQHINSFLQDHAKDFTKGELEAFKVLVQYSIKYKGVANARICIFTKTSHDNNNGHGVSRSTFERMLKKAVELGILTIHKTTKVTKGGKGHNVYVFNRYEVQDIQEKVKEKKTPSKLQKIKMLAIAIKKRNDAPFKRKLKYVNSNKLKHCKNTQNTCDSKDEQPQKEKEAIISKAINKNNNNHLNTKRSAYIKYVPKCLQHFQAFFGKQVKDIYSRVWLAKKKLNVQADQQLMQEIGLIAMNQLKQYVKEGKQLTDEERCKVAYKIGLNQLEQRFAVKNESTNKDVQAIQDAKTMFNSNPYAHKKPVRMEMIPDWLNKETVTTVQTEQQEKTAISEERKKAIWEQVKKLNAGGDYDEQRY